MSKLSLSLCFVLVSIVSSAQEINLTGEIRPRFENRNGYGSPRETFQSAGNFVSQRTRLNLGFKLEKLEILVSLQDVRIWGDVSTTSAAASGLAFQQAWAKYYLHEKWSVKIGRQLLAYDDERIMGGLDWAQTARSHDSFIIQWAPSQKHKLDIGAAYNNDSSENYNSLYSNIAGNKTLQFGWYHGDFNKIGLSFLLLNTGVEYETGIPNVNSEFKINYSQTFGPYLSYESGPFSADFSSYIQTGKEGGKTKQASFIAGSLNYNWKSDFEIGAAGQFLSGKSQDDLSPENKSFNPVFGTNHKFNGWMDYFYVGNFKNSVGLIDLNMNFAYTFKKLTLEISPHYFQSDGTVLNFRGEIMDYYLGTEIDAVLIYDLDENVNIKIGYSQMFASNTMVALKGGTTVDNHWAWAMITVKPTLFKSKSAIPEQN